MTAWLKRHTLLIYFLIAFVIFWGCIGLGLIDRFHFWVPMLGAFAPAVAASVVAGTSEGEAGVRALFRRLGQWRCGPLWDVAVFGLPVAQAIAAVGLAQLFHATKAAPLGGVAKSLGPMLPAIWIVFLFAAGEEVGWRGFALPRLLAMHNGVVASLVLGSVHSVWHWPLILPPHQWLSDVPLVLYSMPVIAEAIVFTWIAQNTHGSVLMATLFHGSSNVAMVLYDGIDPRSMPRFKCGISACTGLALLLLAGPNLARRRPPK